MGIRLFIARSKQIRILLFVLFIFVLPTHAFSLSFEEGEKSWRPVIALGVGTASSSNVGQSQYFPAQIPTSYQFFDYSANHATQTSALMDGFVGVEWNFQPDWAVQAGLDYNQISPFSAKGTLLQGVDSESADSYTYHYGILARQLLVEGKLLYTVKNHYHPYMLMGLGAAFNKAYNYYTSVPPFLTFTPTYNNHTTTSYSYTVGVGMDIDVTPNLRLGMGYRFADLGKVQLGSATINGSALSGTLSQSRLYANELLAQATFII